VVHIDCTLTGESLPTPMVPTWSWRVFRRGASVAAGVPGIPKSTMSSFCPIYPDAKSI
jgi:hypothetical protein